MSSHSPGNPGTATFDHVALTPLVDRSEEPTLLTLYDFVPEIEHPTLLGHWKLDETRTAAPPIMANTQVELRGGSVIDGYDSAAGAYTGATTDAWVYCRNTVARSIHLYKHRGHPGRRLDRGPAPRLTTSSGSTIRPISQAANRRRQ